MIVYVTQYEERGIVDEPIIHADKFEGEVFFIECVNEITGKVAKTVEEAETNMDEAYDGHMLIRFWSVKVKK